MAPEPRVDMRIALISPKGPLYRHRGGIFKKSLRYAPLTLTTLAAYVPPELGARIEILDEGIMDVDPDRVEADLVGITLITGNAPRGYALADRLRGRGVTVVLGGPHPTLVPDEAEAHADAVVVGYAEETWPELLRDFAAGRLRRCYAQRPGLSLAGLPRPRRDLLDPERYFTRAVFEATRSCAHDCEFCVAPTAWGRKQYQKPVEEVVEDIRQSGARKVLFVDLNLVSDPRYAAQLFEALVPLEIRWYGLATTLIAIERDLLELAARSGCGGLLIGLESLCEASLAQTQKGFNDPEAYRAMVADLHRHRIALMGCFAFGLDGDTPDVFERTARFAVEAAIDLPRFAIVTPFPGTPLYQRLDAEGRILTRNWELYDAQHVVFRPRRMTAEQLQRGHERAWRHAYRWTSIASRLLRSRVDPHLTLAANVGYRFYARNLHRFYTCDWFLGLGPEVAAQPAVRRGMAPREIEPRAQAFRGPACG
jgi:radical SAM superfamily enzyme YgiQ (UPF0313 family)